MNLKDKLAKVAKWHRDEMYDAEYNRDNTHPKGCDAWIGFDLAASMHREMAEACEAAMRVTDEDVESALDAYYISRYGQTGEKPRAALVAMRTALESFVNREDGK